MRVVSAAAGLATGAACASGVGCVLVGIGVAAAVYAGLSYGGVSGGIQDLADVEQGDIHAQVGDFCLNFQVGSALTTDSVVELEWLR
mgnify:CR=1 FL=1